MHDSMNTDLLAHRICGTIADFFIFSRPQDIEPAARRVSAFLKDLEANAIDHADKKALHDAVNAFNKALTGK